MEAPPILSSLCVCSIKEFLPLFQCDQVVRDLLHLFLTYHLRLVSSLAFTVAFGFQIPKYPSISCVSAAFSASSVRASLHPRTNLLFVQCDTITSIRARLDFLSHSPSSGSLKWNLLLFHAIGKPVTSTLFQIDLRYHYIGSSIVYVASNCCSAHSMLTAWTPIAERLNRGWWTEKFSLTIEFIFFIPSR